MARLRKYPKPADIRVGIKVSWYYYPDEKTARNASDVAKFNGSILRGQGYDTGYLEAGDVSFEKGAGLWSVVIP